MFKHILECHVDKWVKMWISIWSFSNCLNFSLFSFSENGLSRFSCIKFVGIFSKKNFLFREKFNDEKEFFLKQGKTLFFPNRGKVQFLST